MVEEIKKTEVEKQPEKVEEKKEVAKAPEKKEEEKKPEVKKSEPSKPKKTEAVVNGQNLPISTKHAIAICKYIRGKGVDKAISMLEEVEKMKKAVPMKGEIPHRKGKIMSGRYPIKAVKEIIKLLKSLKSNAVVNELELEKYVIFCVPNVAARPYRRFGRTRFKRTNLMLKLIQPIKKKKKQGGKK
tara:strand:+ start:1246 stop:1803 length:558 start_codon:yes stop_codon:yes gene_type:complete